MKFKILTGIITAAFVLAMNLQYALSEYGILENNLHDQILAQSTGGTGTGTVPSNGMCKKNESCKYRSETKVTGGFPWIIKVEITWKDGTKVSCTAENCPPNSSCYTTDEKPCG